MEPIPADAERSLRRARNRRILLLALASLGEGYLGQLARMTGLERNVVSACLRGRLPRYRPELSLVALGLVAEHPTPNGRVFVITGRGRRKARSVVARLSRSRAERRLHDALPSIPPS